MTATSPLERDMITQTSLWRLVMLVDAQRLEVALIPPVESETLIFRSIPLDPDAPTAAKALEEAIYSNPLLLSDFRSVTCLIDTPQTLCVPAQLSDDDCELLLQRAFQIDTVEAVMSPMGDPDAAMIAALDEELHGFMSRTFFNIRFEHHLAPLCRFLTAVAPADGKRIYALSRHDALDMVAFDSRRLLTANTFETQAPEDAAYYLLASADTLLPGEAVAITAGGLPAATDALTECLARVKGPDAIDMLEMPSLNFKLPQNAAEIPLQLLITSLCE